MKPLVEYLLLYRNMWVVVGMQYTSSICVIKVQCELNCMPCSLYMAWVSDYTVPLGQVLHVYAWMYVRRQESCFNVLLEANSHKARQP